MERASIIARRYAEAYFALAQEAKDIAGWRNELAGVAEVLGDPAVSDALTNPKTSLSERVRQGLKLLNGVSPEARNLARLLIERRRIGIVARNPDALRRIGRQGVRCRSRGGHHGDPG